MHCGPKDQIRRLWISPLALLLLMMEMPFLGCHRRQPLQPPMIRHSGILKDLTAIRAGNQVWISWAMSQRSASKFMKNGFTLLTVCRRDGARAPCVNAGEPLQINANGTDSFSEMLPDQIRSGDPRLLVYSLELSNQKGHSPLFLGDVGTLAGASPPPLRALTATTQEKGVLLRWLKAGASEEPGGTIVRVYRTLLVASNERGGTSSPIREGENATFETQSDQGDFLDQNVRPGESYRYTAQRVVRVPVGDQKLDLTGELSVPVCIRFIPRRSGNPPASEASATPTTVNGCSILNN